MRFSLRAFRLFYRYWLLSTSREQKRSSSKGRKKFVVCILRRSWGNGARGSSIRIASKIAIKQVFFPFEDKLFQDGSFYQSTPARATVDGDQIHFCWLSGDEDKQLGYNMLRFDGTSAAYFDSA